MQKKVLIFSIAYPPFIGGAEVAIKEITNRISDVDFDLITLRFDKNLPKFERIGNVSVYRIGFSVYDPKTLDLVKWPLKINKFLFPFTACVKAISLHRKNHYNAIWAMMAAFAGFAATNFKFFNPRVKYLLSLQEGDPIDKIKEKVRYVYPLFKRIFSSADYIQVISNYLGDYAKGMGYQGKMKVVPNAVDIKHFSREVSDKKIQELKIKLDIKEGDKFLITTSRLVKKNAVGDVIGALQYLPANIKFLILGEGPDREDLDKLCKELKLENRVKFLGLVDHNEMPEYLSIADIFIRPSLSEGLGNSFLEAMAASVPVIATRIGGIPDFLFDPEINPDKSPTGLFCNVNDPENIAEQVKHLIDNNELREKIIRNGKELVTRKYDWDIIANDMKEIFNELMIDGSKIQGQSIS